MLRISYPILWLLLTLLPYGISLPAPAQEAAVVQSLEGNDLTAQLDRAKQLTIGGAYDEAYSMFENIFLQSNARKLNYHSAKSQIGMGNIEINKGNFTAALQRYTDALQLCDTGAALRLRTTLYNNIGNIYVLRGDFISSSHYYEKALSAAEEHGAELPLETLYNNLSIAHNRLHNAEKALSYLEEAEKLALNHNNFYTLADVYNNKGLSYAELQRPEQSMAAFQQAIKVSKNYGYINTLYSAYTNLGIIHLNQQQLDDAHKYFKMAQEIGKDVSSYHKNMLMLAMAALHMKKGSYSAAKPILIASLDLARELDNLKDQITTHELLAEVYRHDSKYDSAFFHKNQQQILSDSFRKKEIAHTVAEIERKYNNALREKELAEKELTISMQAQQLATRSKWIVGVASLATLILALAIFQRKNLLNKQKLKHQELLSERQQHKLNEMRALFEGEEQERIRLSREIHDSIMVQFSLIKMKLSTWLGQGKNTLDMAALRPVVQQLDEATENLRRTVHNLMPDMLREEGLVETLYLFCANVQKMIPTKILFQTVGNIPRFDTAFELTLYRIVQELIQNSIKHADATEVILQLSYQSPILSVTVEDNGKGMDKTRQPAGMGLKSVASRIANFYGNMEIDSSPNVGTSVHLVFDTEKLQAIA